jgi:ADP-heptose:LPS heptosyltransferase
MCLFPGNVKKLILKCELSLGDIVMLTAAVRDLHRCYPRQFATDVRTLCPALWENNPYLSPLSESEREVRVLECSYPLINQCNELPYHCLHGFVDFLNQKLGLAIRPTAFKGDIHISAQEKAWFSQVREIAGTEIPFWLIAAGGKYDVTIKWWDTARYQAVVDHFLGRIQFVQVGSEGDHHPKLNGVIDFRGRTTLRELVRLVYHSNGVLCSVTALMHLAAAVETRRQRPPNRACVVVAGGREPPHWEAYPHHQFIHTNGALPCCADAGCWKDRVLPLRDGDARDRPEHRCVDIVQNLPRCLSLITPEEVIRRIELYFSDRGQSYLSPSQHAAARKAVSASARNHFDQQPLNLHSAGQACERFIRALPQRPPREYSSRGIIICAGGSKYFTNAWVCANRLRHLGCRLPIQLWHLGKKEFNEKMKQLVIPLEVECVDASALRKTFPVRILRGWELKSYAILYSSFRELLFLDADNVPVTNPEFLFDTPEFGEKGAVFWPDHDNANPNLKASVIWRSCGMRPPAEQEFESGQILVQKERCWRALRLALWFNEHSDFYYQHLYGDKETFHLAFRKLRQPYVLVPKPLHALTDTMCQHDFQGRRIFQHRNRDKWDLLLRNKRIKGFQHEEECRRHVSQLRQLWPDGVKAALRLDARQNNCSAGIRVLLPLP